MNNEELLRIKKRWEFICKFAFLSKKVRNKKIKV